MFFVPGPPLDVENSMQACQSPMPCYRCGFLSLCTMPGWVQISASTDGSKPSSLGAALCRVKFTDQPQRCAPHASVPCESADPIVSRSDSARILTVCVSSTCIPPPTMVTPGPGEPLVLEVGIGWIFQKTFASMQVLGSVRFCCLWHLLCSRPTEQTTVIAWF